eukprot:GDKH01010311.1.p1 GENE.GDKH01010311.1~~GDKH01010311.1.p1  ORF type:complete len:242 (-),score=28.07 GDKH01010311.1:81-806(-)
MIPASSSMGGMPLPFVVPPPNAGAAAQSSTTVLTASAPSQPSGPTKNVKGAVHLRKAAGEIWNDKTLDEWPNDDFRIFVGDLGNEVTDDVLKKAFIQYKSYQKSRVVRDKRTGKSRGYGFVSFTQPEDMLKAIKEMDRQYVGNRPCKILRSKWKDREIDSERNKKMNEILVTAQEGSKTLKKFKQMKPVTGGRKEKEKELAKPMWRPKRHYGHPAAFGVTLTRVINNPVKATNAVPGAATI